MTTFNFCGLKKAAPFFLFAAYLLFGIQKAQSQTDYSAILSGSNWNVPLENQLAYGAYASNGLSSPIPLGDQTTWGCQLGVSGCTTSSTTGLTVTGTSGGVTAFTGSATGTMQIGLLPSILSYSAISGSVTSSGALAMVFTSTDSSGVATSGATTTLGLGQFQNIGGVNQMEMQMISGTSLLITHWAYMTPYSGPNSAATAPIANPPSNANPYYSWTAGTAWKIVAPTLFGTTSPGRFNVSTYNGGYFYGYGVGPSANPISYTQIGSITPQGKVLFATMASGTQVLNASYGELTGSSGSVVMTLVDYDSTTASPTGSFTLLSQIAPYSTVISSTNNPAAAGAANTLWNLQTSEAGLTGAMAPVLLALDNYSGKDLSNAISQTLPAMTGAASQATTSSMQALNQIVQGRSNSLRGMASGDEYMGNRDMWMKGFGSWANQNDVNGVSGYKVNTGGLAIGVDQGFTPKLNIGAVLALSNSGVSSNSSSAPSGVTINSYQAGVYGDYAIEKNIIANAQADIGINQNKEYRNITFMGTNANGTYNSYSAHLGTGVKYLMPIDMENTFIPSVRVDYTTVQSQAYSESGAGALNLSVAKQTYNTLIPSADMRIDHSLDSKMTLSANAGAGYNTLNNQVSATSAYAGGGTTFATNGLQVSPWLYNAGVGVTGQIDKNLQLNVRYDNVFSPTGYMNQMVSAKLKIPL